jgi:hypothetical protein
VEEKGVESILVVPQWQSHPFWASLQKDKKFKEAVKAKEEFRAGFVVFNSADSVFSRKSRMDMVAYWLKTGKKSIRLIKKGVYRQIQGHIC